MEEWKSKRSTEDAVIAVIRFIEHLEDLRSFARLWFVDFSSAFKTLQPHILISQIKCDLKVHFYYYY